MNMKKLKTKVLYIYEAFKSLNKISLLIFKVGFPLALTVFFFGMALYFYNILGGNFTFYMEYISQQLVLCSGTVALEVIIGVVLGDYIMKKLLGG